MYTNSDRRFMNAMLCAFEMEANSLTDIICYIHELQKITAEYPDDTVEFAARLNNIATLVVAHQNHLLEVAVDLKQIESKTFVEEKKRPAILDVCDIRSGFLDYPK